MGALPSPADSSLDNVSGGEEVSRCSTYLQTAPKPPFPQVWGPRVQEEYTGEGTPRQSSQPCLLVLPKLCAQMRPARQRGPGLPWRCCDIAGGRGDLVKASGAPHNGPLSVRAACRLPPSRPAQACPQCQRLFVLVRASPERPLAGRWSFTEPGRLCRRASAGPDES